MLIWMTSALYVYEFFEMFHAVCVFPTVPQFETLEYIVYYSVPYKESASLELHCLITHTNTFDTNIYG